MADSVPETLPVPSVLTAPANAAPASKPPRRSRKNREPKDGDGVAVASVSAAEPAVSVELDTATASESLEKNPYIEVVQKRIRNLQKRKQRLDKYEEQAATPDATKLNADQIAALKSKDQVIYPLKELDDLAKVFKTFDADAKKAQSKVVQEQALAVKHAVSVAREDARKETREQMRVLVNFLHVASWKRQYPATAASAAERAAFENLLSLVYTGDDAAVDAVEKLVTGSEELVPADDPATLVTDETSISFASVQKISVDSLEDLYAKANEAAALEEEATADDDSATLVVPMSAATDAAAAADEDEVEPINVVVKVPKGGISFLNESELDVDDKFTGYTAALPVQSVADVSVATEIQLLPPSATQVDDAHANFAAATDWDDTELQRVDAAITGQDSTLVQPEPVWEQLPPTLPVAEVTTPKPATAPTSTPARGNGHFAGNGYSRRGRGGQGSGRGGQGGGQRGGRGNFNGGQYYNNNTNNSNGEGRRPEGQQQNGRGAYYKNRSQHQQQAQVSAQ
ncbi:uncharacterized protein V1518DRAFT_421545 [Limtongia smithiae]|uniref:uncharacterized protein n=1 Tax=Limtongia smithiae TaxID=1125753 RepID=UPI0034CDBFA0